MTTAATKFIERCTKLCKISGKRNDKVRGKNVVNGGKEKNKFWNV